MPGDASARKINWMVVIMGVLLVVLGAAAIAAPWVFLEFLTIWAGAGFVASGIVGLASYVSANKALPGSGWNLVMGILDVVLGVLFIAHPFWFADVIPWMLGVSFIVFGILEVVGMVPLGKSAPTLRATVVISGILSIVTGVLFIMNPASLSIWVAMFAIIQGVSMIVMGFSARIS